MVCIQGRFYAHSIPDSAPSSKAFPRSCITHEHAVCVPLESRYRHWATTTSRGLTLPANNAATTPTTALWMLPTATNTTSPTRQGWRFVCFEGQIYKLAAYQEAGAKKEWLMFKSLDMIKSQRC